MTSPWKNTTSTTLTLKQRAEKRARFVTLAADATDTFQNVRPSRSSVPHLPLIISNNTYTTIDASIHLVAFSPADAKQLAATLDPHAKEMLQHWIDFSNDPVTCASQIISEFTKPTTKAYTIYDQANEIIGLRWITSTDGVTADMGGWLTSEQRGKGLGTKAIQITLAIAANIYALQEMVTATRLDNEPAQRAIKAAGLALTTPYDVDRDYEIPLSLILDFGPPRLCCYATRLRPTPVVYKARQV